MQDSVLSTIEPVLKAHLSSLKNEKDGGPPPIEKSFVRKGDNLARPAKLAPRKSMLSGSTCLLYTSPSPRDATLSRMPSSA